MSQTYITARLKLVDGTILYPQISLDNMVKSLQDSTAVSVVTTVGASGVATNNQIPTAAAVRSLADTKQNTLVAGTGTEIINGSTINAMAVNLNDVVINNVPNNGLYLEVEGNTMSVVAPLAAVDSAGVIAGATNGVTLVDGVVQVNNGDGLLIEDNQIAINDASVETTLQDVRIDDASTVTPVDDQVVTPGNLRGALSVGQAVDVSCAPYNNSGSIVYVNDDFLQGFTATMVNDTTVGFYDTTEHRFPKFADGLVYLFIADVSGSGTVTPNGASAVTLSGTPQRIWTKVTASDSGYISASANATMTVTNWRQYEVTALTDEAIAYIAQLDDPDAFFRSASVYSLRDKYLVKQDMVCPFIPTIGMPDNSDLTVAAGLSYKIKYTNDNQHIITADTIPADAYGWDAHIQMFIKGASGVVFQPPLILMDALTPNAGHNLSVKFRNGQALVYVEDTNAGNIVISTTCSNPSVAGELQYFLLQNPGSGQENYIIFAPSTDGSTCDAGIVSVAYNTNILGNGTDKTTVTGTYNIASGKTMNLQDMIISGATLGGTGTVTFDNVSLNTAVLDTSCIGIVDSVVIPVGSTVTMNTTAANAQLGDIELNGTLELPNGAYFSPSRTIKIHGNGTGVLNGQNTGFINTDINGTIPINVEGETVTFSGIMLDSIPIKVSRIAFSRVSQLEFKDCLITGGTYRCLDIQYNTDLYMDNVTFREASGDTSASTSTPLYLSCRNVTLKNVTIEDCSGDYAIWVGTKIENGIEARYIFEDIKVDKSIGTWTTNNHILTLQGSNVYTSIRIESGTFGKDWIGITVMPNTVLESTSAAVFNLYVSDEKWIQLYDNVTLKNNGITAVIDACKLNTIGANCVLAASSTYGHNIVISGSTVDPWSATNITFASPLDASAASTVKLSGTTFKSTAKISAAPARIQLPANTTLDITGNTNAADTKILQAPVMVVGDNAADPSGSATIAYVGGSTNLSGIGTYVAQNGDNDFRPVASNFNVSNTASSGAGSLLDRLTSASAQATTTNMQQFVGFVSGGTAGVASAAADTTIVSTTILTNDYQPVLGGNYTVSSGGIMTVDQTTRIATIDNQFNFNQVNVPTGAVLSGLSARTSGASASLTGGGTIKLTGGMWASAGKPAVISGCSFVGGGTLGVYDSGTSVVSCYFAPAGSAGLTNRGAHTFVTGCTMTGVSAAYGQGYSTYSYQGALNSTTMDRCVITGNTTTYNAGCDIGSKCSATITNSLISGNYKTAAGINRGQPDMRVGVSAICYCSGGNTLGKVSVTGGTMCFAGSNRLDKLDYYSSTGMVIISAGASITLTSSINPGGTGGIQVNGGTCTVNNNVIESGIYTSIDSNGSATV